MPANIVSENRHLRKQIGCMNGIFQLFDRRHFLTSSHNQNRLLLVGAKQQTETKNTTNEAKEKRRESSESSHASSSSSLDYNRQINISENCFQIKEQRHPLRSKSQQSPDIRDVVKESMNKEARGVRIKSFANDAREVTIKHIDSPRPSQQSKFRKPKATVYEGTKSSKDERLAIARFSCDGRESQDVFKTNMKLKELPRFSLDSKASSMKCSALESKLNIVERESGKHSRSNSIVAKLMGMDAFPEFISTDESLITKMKSSNSPSPSPSVAFLSSTVAEGRKQKQVSSSPPSSRSHNANSIRNTSLCSRLPIEPAPWKQKSYNQGSPKVAKTAKNRPCTSSSVYGEIEKRIAELEFKRSGKDLRALKQILEAMQKTRERLENQGGESAELKLQERSRLEDSSIDQNNSFSNIQTFKRSSPNQVTRTETMHQEHKEKAKYRTPRSNNMKEAHQHLPSIGKKITQIRVENCTTSERDCRMVSPRVHHIVLKTEGESHPKSSTFESGRVKKQSSKKVREKCPNRNHRMKTTNMQLSDDQLSNLSSETRYSSCLGDTASTKSKRNVGMASHIETDNFISSNSREKDYVTTSKAVEFAVIMTEQPSPVSVLETSFYSEGSPSPVKKRSSAFRDESPNPSEVEWHLENLNHLTDYRKSDSDYKYNQKSENMHLFHEPILLKSEDNGAAADHNEPDYQSINPAQRYISKMILASPLQMKLSQEIQRKIVPDVINEILARKMISGGLFTMGRKRVTFQGITKEVYLEMDNLCSIPYCSPHDEDDGSIRLLTTDMKYQSDDWTDYCSEVPALVLDIERLIFKDLINEIVTCDVVCSRDRPTRHCRQLFTKKSL